MEKSNSTKSGFNKYISSFCFLLLFVFSQNLNAQCSLGLNTETQISLDQNCSAEVTSAMILNDQATSCPNGVFIVNVKDLDENIIPSSPFVTGAYINQTLIAEVVDTDSGNTGWGYINIEDKLAPVITCADVTVDCSDISEYQPTVIDACDPNPVVTLVSQTEQQLPCDATRIKIITRTYQATDNQGNVSAPCTQDITVQRIDLTAVLFPADVDFGCFVNYPVDDEGNPSPTYTGSPSLGGQSIWPTTDLGCNTITTYNDLVLPPIGGVQKIMRTWTVNEWYCGGSNTETDVQIIEILDDQGPVVSNCPADYTVSTTAGTDCQAWIVLPTISAVDACGTVDRIDVSYPGGFEPNGNGALVYLDLGYNEITYTIYDNNQNTTECTFEVLVSDDTAPVVVCDQNTVVSLSIDGTALVNAISFDDGSYDDCTTVDFEVRRMDNGVSCPPITGFGPTAKFCCSDIGTTVVVVLRVRDQNFNYNECMVNVTVQDKLAPTITCPAPITVNCDTPYDLNNLDEFGVASAVDNCATTLNETAPFEFINQCRVGYILRTFQAVDVNGVVTAVCQQTITFENDEPFVASDIVWPNDQTITQCVDPESLHPDATGYPIITEDACDKVGFDWTDKTFQIVNGDNACFKIIRSWEVLDWCQLDANGNFLTFPYQQTIVVQNLDAPEFTGDYPDLVECTYDQDCASGSITLTADAEDACTAELLWTYRVDLDNDGDFDITSATVLADSVDASGTYPLGDHRVVYTAEDGCGNAVSQTQLFTIVNCKLPTPYCLNGLAIELMPIDTDGDNIPDEGMIDTWASDFDAGSFHSCGLPVTVSFSADPLDTGRMFTCADLGDNPLQIWAHVVLPNGDILQDFCITNVNIQDNNGVCPDDPNTSTLVVIEGDVKDEMDQDADKVSVVLQGSELIATTDEFGVYAFPAMEMGGQYELIPTKDEDDKLNGISTLDIVLIQKHILGLEILDSPYKVIAADVNNDATIAGTDIINLRRLLLGKDSEMMFNTDWRFIDAGYNFLNPTDPLQEDFDETYMINNLSSDMSVNFVAIKVGDVNNTSKANLTSGVSDTRSMDDLNLSILDKKFTNGETVELHVTADELSEIYGLQFTAKFNNMYLEYAGISAGALDMTEEANLGLSFAQQGVITASWSSSNLTNVKEGDVLFTLKFVAQREGQISGNVGFNSEITTVEAYNAALEVMDINLNFRTNDGEAVISSPFAMYQNIPNPFAQTTNIAFNLPASSAVKFSVFDVSGKLIYSENGVYAKGMNNIDLNVADFNATGILYYQIETNEHTATRKMVVLK